MKEVKNYVVKLFKNEYPTLSFQFNEMDYSNSKTALSMGKNVCTEYNKKEYSYSIFEETTRLISMIINEKDREYCEA